MDINEKMIIDEAKKIYKENNNRIVNDDTSFVSLRNINKIYPNNVQAVFDFNLDIDKNDFIALVGPSGCGKSTTLRMIAGLEDISSGKLYIDKVLANYLESKDRDIAMVFQSYALYPQLNVYDNIAFGLNIRKMDKSEIQERVFKAADILDLGPYLDRKPKELSGGQMQRVALGRAIVRNAQLFLMDEPLSNLDAKLRVQMRSEIVRIHEEVGATTIYVTHDQVEAMTMANRIVVMNKGFIQQVGSPIDVYDHPINLFVATFIGTPPMNILDVTYEDGIITFEDGFKLEISSKMKEEHDSYYRNKLEELHSLASDIDNMSVQDIKNYKLNVVSRTYDVEKKNITFDKKKKETIIGKLISKFKKTNNNLDIDIKFKEEFKEEINKVIKDYNDALLNSHFIKFGVRPEDIYLIKENNSKDNLSESFDVDCSMIEVLGSELIIYGKKGNDKLTIKLQDKVKSHTIQKFAIDLEKIHLFDRYSGENISFKE